MPNALLEEIQRNELLSQMDPRDTANALTTAPSGAVANIGGNFLPFIGDAVGLAQDADMYWRDPGSRRWYNYLLSAVGLLPAVPAVAGLTRAEKTAKVARAKRRVGTTGAYVGAPKGVDSPQKYSALIDAYANRIERALDAGLKPGWFYGQGRKAIADVAVTPQAGTILARTNAVTSSEAPVRSNVGWAIKAMEQDAVGAPINSGKYPNAMRSQLERVVRGSDEHLGHKRDRYGAGLDPSADPGGLAPNDRWEIRSFGYDTDTAGPAQHSFMDEARQKALERVAKRRGVELTPLEAQELNWAVQRADDMGTSIAQSAQDSVHEAMNAATFQHSWESIPGATSRHLSRMRDETDEALRRYHETVRGIFIDPQGKDRLIAGMGGQLQPSAFDAPGIFQGRVSPGTQSRSLVAQTQAHGIDPASMARVQATEGVRGLVLGQDAIAGHSLLPAPSAPKTDTRAVDLGRTLTDAEALPLNSRLEELYGAGNTGIVPTPSGFNLLDTGADKFGKRTSNLAEQLAGTVDVRKVDAARRQGFYEELPWEQGGATARVLEMIDNPAAPGLARNADSQPVRDLMGEMADLYQGMPGHNERLQLTLRAWKSGGLEAVRNLVRQGIAPAAVLSLLAAQGARQQTPEG